MSAGSFGLRLATRNDGTRDGELMLVSPSGKRWVSAKPAARAMQELLDRWPEVAPVLAARCSRLDADGWSGAAEFVSHECMAPLPRAFQWADASVYFNHARLMYQWRKEPIPARYAQEPLVYQGGSDHLVGPLDPIVARDEAHQIDLEAEIAVITTDVDMGCSVEEAANCIALVVLLNDVSLRGLIPGELAKGFGFYQSKPATSFAPLAVTPAALGKMWKNFMPSVRVKVQINEAPFGDLRSDEGTVFNFAQIIAFLAQTRRLSAGTIIGAGTISNEASESGSACITEARVRQTLEGVADDQLYRYLRAGDRVRIEAVDDDGASVFGAIDQEVQLI